MTQIITKIGAVLVGLMVIVAVVGPWVMWNDPMEYHIDQAFHGVSVEFLFGHDADGRDILSRLVYGARISLGIAFIVVAVSLVIGTTIGLIAGYMGGIFEKSFLIISDIFMAFPGFLFALSIAAFMQPSILNVIIILCLRGWVSYARLVRGQVLSLKKREYIIACQAMGARLWRILFRHLLPNMIGPIVINASFGMAGVIMIESSLSFLGLGVPVGTPSWGAMLDQGTKYLLVDASLSLYPGFAIMLVVMGFNFLGDGLRDYLTPRGK